METDRAEQQLYQDDASRFWREEREEGAIYQVFLKKVTYLSEARLEDESEKEFSHLMWETQKVRVIRAGTLSKLVESLTNSRGEMDSSYVSIFLATFRTFATPHQVLEAITERYKNLRSEFKGDKYELLETQQSSLKSVIFVWLDTYPEDFHEASSYTCLQELQKFAQEHAVGTGIEAKVQEKLIIFKREDSELAARTLNKSFSMSEVTSYSKDTDSSRSLALLEISCRKIAQQLTYKDADLFKKVIPHHCLGGMFSRRDKNGESLAPTVQATIQQFNSVSLRVTATVLRTLELTIAQRARVLQKWILIAQDLRELKNFSSLKAIITGLQSNSVYRLRRTWSALPKDALVVFEELSEIFSIENNQCNARELLMKEATAKFPDLDSQSKTLKKKNMMKRRSWIDNGTVQGTVPYLGTFLTDLTMLDTAIPSKTDGLINFEKRRKEFEVLAQLKLLQSAASIYTINEDESFWRWFNSIRVYSDTESHELSCALEPQSDSSSTRKKSTILGMKPAKLEKTKVGLVACGVESRNSIVRIPDTIAASIGPVLSHSATVIPTDADIPSSTTPFKSPNSFVIKVSMDTSQNDAAHVYKSIMLMNSDHTHTVVEKILEKYNIERQSDNYSLVQILPDGELTIPDRVNVFYALNTLVEPKFKLVTKEEDTSIKDKDKKKAWKK